MRRIAARSDRAPHRRVLSRVAALVVAGGLTLAPVPPGPAAQQAVVGPAPGATAVDVPAPPARAPLPPGPAAKRPVVGPAPGATAVDVPPPPAPVPPPRGLARAAGGTIAA